MTQDQQWTVHDKDGGWLGTFPHPTLADFFASNLADITEKEYLIRDTESPAQKVVRFLKESTITGEKRL